MNSWTCFLHGEGGGSLVNLKTRSKTCPMYLGEIGDVLVEGAVIDGKEADLSFPRGTNCAKCGVPTVARSFVCPVRPRTQQQFYLDEGKA